ncbi:Uncharacterized protein SCG7086_CT_00040 [Chlamydiales bacterium SCGC AG-110-P3]|nr:Uncharacterized protein SCG7086_CT_00040 [Chlamydiales bacterium SCGC AG-110-P3]
MSQGATHNSPLAVYVDRLRGGGIQSLEAELGPEYLAVDDSEARIKASTRVTGEASLAVEELLIRFSAATSVHVPCTVCTRDVVVPVEVTDCCHVVSEDECPHGIYDVAPLVREELVMALPRFVECEGHCPERSAVNGYISDKESSASGRDTNEPADGYRPFADL